MTYDFTTFVDRRGKDSSAADFSLSQAYQGLQVKEGFSPIPMWVADMSFPTLPAIQEAMARRISHPSFGYFPPSQEYFQAIIDWHKTRKGVQDLEKVHIGYENGVLGGVVSALEVLCSPGDCVLVHSPTYIGFTGSLTNHGYRIVHSPLYLDEQNVWRMDFQDMEEKLKTHKIHTAIFCSPHNPCGRVWEQWEIERAMELFRRYDVYVISDEIWSDILLDGHRHIPTQSVSPDAKMRTVALYAPSKTFSLAGLVGSYRIVYNPWLRERIEKASSLSHYNSMNVVSMHALIGAYSPQGHQWTDELCQVLSGTVDFACAYIASHFEGVTLSHPQGTYMLFLDCTQWCAAHGKTLDELFRAGVEAGVIWQDGRAFNGPCHIRMNLAAPRQVVEEAFHRLNEYVF